MLWKMPHVYRRHQKNKIFICDNMSKNNVIVSQSLVYDMWHDNGPCRPKSTNMLNGDAGKNME